MSFGLIFTPLSIRTSIFYFISSKVSKFTLNIKILTKGMQLELIKLLSESLHFSLD